MSNKTCGECKHFDDIMLHCEKFDCLAEDGWSCPACEEKEKPKPTNGDVIRQGDNRAIAEFVDKVWKCPCEFCVYAKYIEDYGFGEGGFGCKNPDEKDCVDGIEAWLNAPAKEGEDE